MSGLITLTTDFGERDPFVGIMKGVIYGIAPKTTCIDLTHHIEPQDVQQAAWVLSAAHPYFPKKTVHLAVVDPGVGTSRRAILVKTKNAYWVGPDNGVLTPAMNGKFKVYELSNPKYFLESSSATFHGRDIFAPVAAHLASGIKPSKMGQEISDPVVLQMPRAYKEESKVCGQVIYSDRFGNLATNIDALDVKNGFPSSKPVLRLGRRTLKHFVGTYGECPDNQPGFLINSWNVLEIFVRNGNAQEKWKVRPGMTVTLSAG